MELEIFVLVLYYMRDMKRFEGKKNPQGDKQRRKNNQMRKSIRSNTNI